jgi:hypothetical protein
VGAWLGSLHKELCGLNRFNYLNRLKGSRHQVPEVTKINGGTVPQLAMFFDDKRGCKIEEYRKKPAILKE